MAKQGAFVALFGYATEERAKGIVERIREYHLTPDGFYFLPGAKGDERGPGGILRT